MEKPTTATGSILGSLFPESDGFQLVALLGLIDFQTDSLPFAHWAPGSSRARHCKSQLLAESWLDLTMMDSHQSIRTRPVRFQSLPCRVCRVFRCLYYTRDILESFNPACLPPMCITSGWLWERVIRYASLMGWFKSRGNSFSTISLSQMWDWTLDIDVRRLSVYEGWSVHQEDTTVLPMDWMHFPIANWPTFSRFILMLFTTSCSTERVRLATAQFKTAKLRTWRDVEGEIWTDDISVFIVATSLHLYHDFSTPECNRQRSSNPRRQQCE